MPLSGAKSVQVKDLSYDEEIWFYRMLESVNLCIFEDDQTIWNGEPTGDLDMSLPDWGEQWAWRNVEARCVSDGDPRQR